MIVIALIVGLAIVVFAAWGFVNPFVGLLGLLAVNVIQPGELYPVLSLVYPERTMAIAVMLSFLIHRGKVTVPPISRMVFIFWFVMFLGVPLAFWRTGALLSAMEFGKVVIYHVLVVNLVTTRKRFWALLVTYTLLLGWLSGTSFFNYVIGNYITAQGIARAAGLTSAGGDPNTLAITLVSGLPLAGLVAFYGKGRARLMALGVSVVSVLTVVVTGSRASFYTLLFMTGVAVVFSKRGILYAILLAMLAPVGWFLIPQQYKERYTEKMKFENLEQDPSYMGRILAWQAARAMFKDYPLTGVGARQFIVANGSKYWPGEPKRWLNAHSLYFQLLAELGIVGCLAFAAFLLRLFYGQVMIRRALAAVPDTPGWMRYFPFACLLSLLCLLFVGYSSHNLYRSTWYFLAALTASLELIGRAEGWLGQRAPAAAGRASWKEAAESEKEVSPVASRAKVRTT